MKLEKLLRLALRASTLLLLGSGGGAGAADEEDVEFSPPPMPPQPPVDCRELQDFSEIKNQEPVSFCYQQEIIGAVTEGDAFLFRPEAPADMEHMIAAAREFMPWFTCQAEMRSRDEACGVIYSAMQKQGLVILRETIRASVFEIPPRTRYAAPAGKQVTLTVNGVETRPEPGVYRGSVIFTVADAFDIVHGRSHYPARAAVCIVNGYRPEYSVPAAVISGTVTDETAKDIVIDSRNDNFNPILVGGSGSYSIQSPKITMVGHGGDDFAGYGAGIMVTGSANVTVDNADIETTGSVRTAVWAGDHAALLVKNSRIAGHEGDTTDFKVGVMNTVPWPLGLSGNLVQQAGPFALLGGAALLGLYALCWYASKDHPWGMVTGLVLLSLDSLFLIFFILAGGPKALVLTLADTAIHIWLLVWIIGALRALSLRKFMKKDDTPPEE